MFKWCDCLSLFLNACRPTSAFLLTYQKTDELGLKHTQQESECLKTEKDTLIFRAGRNCVLTDFQRINPAVYYYTLQSWAACNKILFYLLVGFKIGWFQALPLPNLERHLDVSACKKRSIIPIYPWWHDYDIIRFNFQDFFVNHKIYYVTVSTGWVRLTVISK